jgi:hypothetical protein
VVMTPVRSRWSRCLGRLATGWSRTLCPPCGFADDIVVGFQVKSDAERFRMELTERFRTFHLQVHPEKTRLLEFGPFAGAEPSAQRSR